MNAVLMNTQEKQAGQSWWREPYVWLVIGGPLIVVVAGVVTAFIAFERPDPVIDRNSYQQELMLRKQSEDAKALLDDLAKLQPANQARNHAASPVSSSSSADTK